MVTTAAASATTTTTTEAKAQQQLKVALIGGTGRVGGWVLEELINRQHDIIKVLARTPSKLSAYEDKITSIVTGDATNESALMDLLDDNDIDVLISTIGSPNNETLVVEATAKALVSAVLKKKRNGGDSYVIPRIIWMTTIGVNEAIPQGKMYPIRGNPSKWCCGYSCFGWLMFNMLIPCIIGQDLWDDMGASELIMRENDSIRERTVIVRPTNMHPVSEHPTFSEEWRSEGGDNTKYVFVSADDPPPGNWINRRAIACALCDLIHDSTRDGTAVSLFQDGKP